MHSVYLYGSTTALKTSLIPSSWIARLISCGSSLGLHPTKTSATSRSTFQALRRNCRFMSRWSIFGIIFIFGTDGLDKPGPPFGPPVQGSCTPWFQARVRGRHPLEHGSSAAGTSRRPWISSDAGRRHSECFYDDWELFVIQFTSVLLALGVGQHGQGYVCHCVWCVEA